MTAQAHSYSEMPFGAWDVPKESKVEHIEDHAIARLKGLGFTADQAAAFIAEHSVSTVRSASDGALKKHLAVAKAASDEFDPADHNIAEVTAYVGDDPAKAAAVLTAEQAGKARKTLLEQLEELAVPVDSGVGTSNEAGAASPGESDDANPSD